MKTPEKTSLEDVVSAWEAAGFRSDKMRHGFLARPFLQGVVLQHLEQERQRRRGGRGMIKPKKEALHAIRVTRRWLEFGEYP